MFIELNNGAKIFCFGDGFLWVGTDKVEKINPQNGTMLERYNINPRAAELYFNEMFWRYNETDNKLLAYSLSSVGVEKGKDRLPTNYSLSQNYPNPFNPSTSISYHLPVNGFVTLKVYDVLGDEVATLVNGEKHAGEYEIEFDAANLSSGVYFYQLQAGSLVETKKMLLLK